MTAEPFERSQPRRFRRALTIVVAVAIGVVLGTTAGLIIISQRAINFTSTTTFAVLPPSASASIDTGQLALLTPVFATTVSDPLTESIAREFLGGSDPAPVIARTYPDSALTFTVSATAPTAQLAQDSARAYGQAMLKRSLDGDLVSQKAVRLQIISQARLPLQPDGLSPSILMVGSNAIALLLVFALYITLFPYSAWFRSDDS